MRSWLICLFINLFVCVAGYCQNSLDSSLRFEKQITFTQTLNKPAALPTLKVSQNFSSTPPLPTIKALPTGYYYNSIGFFCQKELQVEKALKMPLKFRLGSLNYTDKMEGKGQTYLPPSKR